MIRTRQESLDLIRKRVGYVAEVDGNSKLPQALLNKIAMALTIDPLNEVNEKLTLLLKISLEAPITQEEIQNAINKFKD